jgi:Lrp/AsnC family transcriptional regulator, regulator for asnA, asnC and gidA
MKKFPIKLDEKDRKILLALETNARQSNAQIARKAGLSEEVVAYRIRKYVKSGIINKFFIIPNFDRLGFTTYRVYFQLQGATPAMEQEVVEYLRDKTPCQWLGVCDGRWDVIGRISAPTLFEFNNIMDAFLARYGQYIRQKEVTLQLRHTWWPSTYGLSGGAAAKIPPHSVPKAVSELKHDAHDIKILSILMDDARMPTVEIAKKAGLSADTVGYRIRRLVQEGVITQMKSYFNREMLGYQHNQVFVRFYQNPEKAKAVVEYLNCFPECFFVSSMVGAWDMQFGIDARNSVEFHEMFGKIKERFPDAIRDYESLIVYKEYAPNPFEYFLREMKE